MRVSVVVFPGSNCDHDAIHTYQSVLKQDVSVIWHKETDLRRPDVVVIPGGFTFGDYLRTGAMAKVSPIMTEIRKFAENGGSLIGICNGFQILCEAGILPGALLQNIQMKFMSRFLTIKVETTSTPFTSKCKQGQLIRCPVAHYEGNFFATPEMIRRLEGEGQVVFRYCSEKGEVDPENLEWNPNGSVSAIAGICNEKRNVVGLMPHPERAVEDIVGYIGGHCGLEVFTSAIAA